MHRRGKLQAATRIIAIGRREYTDERMRREFKAAIGRTPPGWDAFARRITYHKLEFHDPVAYDALLARVNTLPSAIRDNRMFYFATPPNAFDDIIKHLARTGLCQREPHKGWHRIVFEKPFGTSAADAHRLHALVSSLVDETQTYRIDHYLGKSFVQEILAIRFANPVFDQLWSRDSIDNIQIVVCESAGVGTRGGYYDGSGAIRDMVQNHLLQLLSLAAMEQPTRMTPHEIKQEKARVLHAIQPVRGREVVVTGQYTAGKTSEGRIPDYRKEEGITPVSRTETYAAIKLHVHNHRWSGVPFYLRTGKALLHHYAEIVVTFKQGPCVLFGDRKCPPSNELVIRIQPDEGVKFRFNLADENLDDYSGVDAHWMDFCHEAQGFNTPQAYETLLEDVMIGDQMLFTSWAFLEQTWRITDALRALAPHTPQAYRAGTHGPENGLKLMRADGRDWAGNVAIAHEHTHKIERKKGKK